MIPTPMIILRECRTCGYQGPLTAFEANKHRFRFGRTYRCLPCKRAASRARYYAVLEDPEKKAALREREKLYVRSLREDPEYREKENKRRRISVNPEHAARMREYARELYKDPAKREARNAKAQARFKERYANDPELRKAHLRSNYKRQIARRVKKIDVCVERQRGLCAGKDIYAGCLGDLNGLADEMLLHLDHIYPVSRGGTDDLDNLQAMCAPCNLHKADRTMEEWGEYLEALEGVLV